MTGAAAEAVAVTLLAASLAFAVLRPRGLSEALVAVPAGALAVLTGIVPLHDALRALRAIGPTVGFLAAILVFAHLCAEAGVFSYLAARAASAGRGDPRRLLVLVVGLAAAVTATLTLDSTVVLLTPVVLATTARLGLASRPYSYACARLANSGSLLLPVSNLTNLLAFGASGLSFGRFTALMALPWALVCGAEWLALRVFFRADLATGATLSTDRPPAPRYALVVLAVTVALFVVASAVHVAPAWAALAGCAALLLPRVRRRDVRVPLRGRLGRPRLPRLRAGAGRRGRRRHPARSRPCPAPRDAVRHVVRRVARAGGAGGAARQRGEQPAGHPGAGADRGCLAGRGAGRPRSGSTSDRTRPIPGRWPPCSGAGSYPPPKSPARRSSIFSVW